MTATDTFTPTLAPVGYKGLPVMTENTAWDNKAKNVFAYKVLQANPDEYFQYGIAPLCIFCAAVFSIFWGTLAGVLIRKVNMDDYKGVEKCIENYAKSEETIRKAGLKPQAPAAEVMKTMKAVGVRITNVS